MKKMSVISNNNICYYNFTYIYISVKRSLEIIKGKTRKIYNKQIIITMLTNFLKSH